MPGSIYELSCRLITGEMVPLSRFRGRVLLVVNTASYCGFTPQYAGLEQLQRDYAERGFSVLAFPSNDFFEEPLGDQKVHEFCLQNYEITFPLFARVHVNGSRQDPLFALLKAQAPGLFGSRAIKWNFCKFLISRDGRVVRRFGPFALPSLLRRHIEPLLQQPVVSGAVS
jgi:glutathione peroxidase